MASIAEAFDQPFEEAIRYFRGKGSVTTKSWTDVYAAAHSRAFMVAGAASDALVADFRAEIDRALTDGTSLADFRKAFDVIVEKHGWSHTGTRNWRSSIIFDANLRTAYAAGRWVQQTAPDTLAAFPYLQYHHSGSLHPRIQHLHWDGLVLRADDPWLRTNYPPNGWRCGCYMTSCSHRDLGRMGKKGPDEAPPLEFRAEEVGGRTVRVPLGIDPGWEYNVGEAWLSRTLPGSQTVAAAPGMIRRFVESALAGRRPPESYIPVAIVPTELAATYRLPAGTEVRLSAETVLRHRHHAEADGDAYGRLPELAIGDGLVLDLGGRAAVFFEEAGQIWRMGLKPTSNAEFYVTTLHRSNAEQLGRFARRGTVISMGKNAPGGSALPR